MTTTASHALLPRQEGNVPAPGVNARSNRLVTAGYAADGRPTGSVFFWSHTRFHDGFTFDLHPHQGFEIVSVVLEGRTSHFDTLAGRWNDLAPGDVQIIRSGSGIEHRERATAGARVFQIWLDPGMAPAIRRPASYTDHPEASLPTRQDGPVTITEIAGGGGPVAAETEGLTIQRVTLEPNSSATLPLGPDRLAIAFTIAGAVTVNDVAVPADDAALTVGARSVMLQSGGRSEVFLLCVPATPSHPLLRDR